jgi:hypothetical protein
MIRRVGRFAGHGLAGALALALSAAAAPATEQVAPVDMVETFDAIVFHAEFGQSIEPRVTKWVSPLQIYLDIRAGDPTLYLRLVQAHIADLSGLTGLPMEIVPTPDDANVFMVFDRDDALIQSAADHQPTIARHAEELGKTLCFGIYSVNGSYEIKRAVIGIPTDRATSLGKLPACVVEEMTQVLGLPNDSDEVSPSIFNDRSEDDALTDLDRWLVRLLYDPSVEPGMDRPTALAQVRSLAGDPLIAQQQLPSPGHDATATASRTGGDLGQDTGNSNEADTGIGANQANGDTSAFSETN